MKSRISGRISRKEKDEIRLLVKKKVFSSLSEFYRTAITRFLKELNTCEKKRLLKKKGTLGKALKKDRREVERDMKELVRFIEDLY
jgi:Arc/MetJ-type ribon-helix-helix transcriptional regulator